MVLPLSLEDFQLPNLSTTSPAINFPLDHLIMLYKSIIRPWLFSKDPEQSHDRTLNLLSRLQFLHGPLDRLYRVTDKRLNVQIKSLIFSNPVGLAGGFDKNAVALKTISAFGFGFMEMGAVTAQAQPGNPKPRLYRLPEDCALINRLGFNNEGATAIAKRLDRLRDLDKLPGIPLGINIGRTKIVETKDAVADFLSTFEKLYSHGDFFTLNVSSPNTPNLRDLQEKTLLGDLLGAVQERNRQLAAAAQRQEKPVFVKIAPDMEFAQVDQIVEVVDSFELAGIVATNATAFMRESVKSPLGREPGGLSGRPITSMVTNFVSHIYKNTGGRLPIIGVGGIFNAQDAYDKIIAGASAVQIYTGFIYEGPAAVKRINQGLLKLLERDGFKSVGEAVGQAN
jgi:dihydroorotate dehydrogenase